MRGMIPAAWAALLVAVTPAGASGFADHAAIDRAVSAFTGAAAGTPGGARLPVDRRLRLADCPQQLALDWYGQRHDTVVVACPQAGGWRIFVPVSNEAGGSGARAMIGRGDAVTISVRGRGFALSRQAQALEAGGEGDWVRVRPAGNGEPIRARVLRPGVVGMDLP